MSYLSRILEGRVHVLKLNVSSESKVPPGLLNFLWSETFFFFTASHTYYLVHSLANSRKLNVYMLLQIAT